MWTDGQRTHGAERQEARVNKSEHTLHQDLPLAELSSGSLDFEGCCRGIEGRQKLARARTLWVVVGSNGTACLP